MLLSLWPEKTKVGFMSWRLPTAILSIILIAASIFMVSTRGLNFGIDFIGGSVVEINKPASVENEEEVRSALADLGLGPITVVKATAAGGVDQETLIVRIKTQEVEEGGNADTAQTEATDLLVKTLVDTFDLRWDDPLTEDVNEADDPATAADEKSDVLSRSSVGPKVSGELLTNGIMALVVALALMLAYIWFRFEWQFSVGAVAALTHDVILTIGMFALLQLEFNLTTIAALLTIIGYSMNDTVVVFDRVREEMRKYKQMPMKQVVDLALNGTLSRTLLTSGTTLLALLAIFFLGGSVLRGMSFALIWGVIIGTYSSIFIASSILLSMPTVRREKIKLDDTPGFQASS